MSTRATDTARIMKFTKELGGVNVILGIPHLVESIFFKLLNFVMILGLLRGQIFQ